MFENFVSLGHYCGVAGSMSKYGLRGFSGPFDWLLSDFEGVIKCLDTDFKWFLSREYLEDTEDRLWIRNVQYGLCFPHEYEYKKGLPENYHLFCEKYERRIERFRRCVKQKTCFIRSVKDKNEVEYILNNQDYIKEVLRKSCIKNDIIYILSNQSSGFHELPFPFFAVESAYKTAPRTILRGLFDTNCDLVEFFRDNLNENTRNSNLLFDNKKELEALNLTEIRYQLLTKLEFTDWDLIDIPDTIIIYGAGNLGKVFYRKIRHRCRVLCFVDKENIEKSYEDIPVICPQDLAGYADEDAVVIVTTIYDYNAISWHLQEFMKGGLKMVSLETILAQN